MNLQTGKVLQNIHYYRGIDCIKKGCEKLRDRATEIINYEEKNMIPQTDKETRFYEEQKVYHICKKEFCYDENKENEFKLYPKVRDHCYYTRKFRRAAHSICNLSYKIPKEIPVVIHNSSTYDCHFIIKELSEEFKGQFKCLRENTENILLFQYQLKKKLLIVKKKKKMIIVKKIVIVKKIKIKQLHAE